MKQIFFLAILSFLIATLPVDAHQIKTDNGITVLLHVDPSDEPYSGTTTQMYLVFTNTDQINPDECNCVAYIAPYSQLENITETGTRFDFSTQTERVMGSYSIAHVFPKHDIYAVVLEGAPKEVATFEPFRIVYDLRVARGEEIDDEKHPAMKSTPHVITQVLLTGAVISLILIGILLRKRLYKK